MYVKHSFVALLWVLAVGTLAPVQASGQEHDHAAPPAAQQPPPAEQPSPAEQVDHSQHAGHEMPAATLFLPREASGTAWVPDLTPMHAFHGNAGSWELMLHGQAFAQFLYEGGEVHRTSHQGGSINWIMAMARRPAGAGRLGLRAMLSLEPWTISGCGYPDLLATGETCDGDTIHDRQHPHDLFMEVAAEYDRPIGAGLRWQIYGGPAAEPALGPAGFPHRASAAPNPIAPIGHHWLDATHITFGVVTTGVYGARWKADASIFNGREPDEDRTDFDPGALDSYAARFTIMPVPAVSVQVSAGYLTEAEVYPGLDPVDVKRATASVTLHRGTGANVWATMLAWGVNVEKPDGTMHALLLESSATMRSVHTVFGRLEIVGKSAHDLHAHEFTGIFTLGKLQAGYTRYLPARGGLQAGVGGTVSASLVPPALAPRYGGRIAPGVGVFLTIRPAMHAM